MAATATVVTKLDVDGEQALPLGSNLFRLASAINEVLLLLPLSASRGHLEKAATVFSARLCTADY
jgi:hypothetical protein